MTAPPSRVSRSLRGREQCRDVGAQLDRSWSTCLVGCPIVTTAGSPSIAVGLRVGLPELLHGLPLFRGVARARGVDDVRPRCGGVAFAVPMGFVRTCCASAAPCLIILAMSALVKVSKSMPRGSLGRMTRLVMYR